MKYVEAKLVTKPALIPVKSNTGAVSSKEYRLVGNGITMIRNFADQPYQVVKGDIVAFSERFDANGNTVLNVEYTIDAEEFKELGLPLVTA